MCPAVLGVCFKKKLHNIGDIAQASIRVVASNSPIKVGRLFMLEKGNHFSVPSLFRAVQSSFPVLKHQQQQQVDAQIRRENMRMNDSIVCNSKHCGSSHEAANKQEYKKHEIFL